MELLSEIKRVFQCEEIVISERMNTVETQFITTVQKLPEEERIQMLCDSIPERDNIKIILRNDSDRILVVTNKKSDDISYITLTDGLLHEDNIEITIQIDKWVSANRFSIYCYEAFTKDLLSYELVDILKWFSARLSSCEYLIFEVFDSDVSFSTGTMAFISNECLAFSPKISRAERLQVCRETSYFYDMNSFEVIPEDFSIEGIVQATNGLKPLFGKLCTILSIIYVSSSSSIIESTLSVQIIGQRATTCSFEMKSINENARWQTVYSWLFTDGNPTDKALIARNVISLHCKYTNFLDIDERVSDSIMTNYNLYLRNNVAQYLSLKRDISKYILSAMAQVGENVFSILNKLKTNLIAIFGFLFTVVLTKVGATQRWDNIFSRDTIYIIELVLIGSVIYIGICFFEARCKLKKAKEAYNALKRNYTDVLSTSEINEAFGEDKLYNDTEKSTRKGIILWTIIWVGLLAISITVTEFLTPDKGVLIWLIRRLTDVFCQKQ